MLPNMPCHYWTLGGSRPKLMIPLVCINVKYLCKDFGIIYNKAPVTEYHFRFISKSTIFSSLILCKLFQGFCKTRPTGLNSLLPPLAIHRNFDPATNNPSYTLNPLPSSLKGLFCQSHDIFLFALHNVKCTGARFQQQNKIIGVGICCPNNNCTFLSGGVWGGGLM